MVGSKTPERGGSGGGAGGSLAARGGVGKASGGRGRGGAARAKAAEANEEMDAASFRGLFSKDLRIMMYGFGDSSSPLDETVDLVEDIVLEYIKDITHRAVSAASDALKTKLDEKDLLFVVRKEPAKFGRMRELLTNLMLINNARKAVDASVDEMGDGAAAGGSGGASGAGAAAPQPQQGA